MDNVVQYTEIAGDNFSPIITDRLDKTEPLMFDTETVTLYGKIRLAQFYQKGWKDVLLVHNPDAIELVLLLSKTHFVAHHSHYDITTIQKIIDIPWVPDKFDDTLYLSRLYYYANDKYSLDNCLTYLFGYNPYKEHFNLSKSVMQKSDWGASKLTEDQKIYSASDVIYLQDLWDIVKVKTNTAVYKLDIKALRNALVFQNNGLPVDKNELKKQYDNNTKMIRDINLPINCNSFKQVREYINSSHSDDEGLAKLAIEGNTKAKDVRTTRKLIKQNSFLSKFDTIDDRIYGKFSPTAKSGRFRCSDQNLQQLPRATKNCFGVSEDSGKVILYTDFSQLELRCVCSITNDSVMLRLFEQDIDIHTFAAQKIFHTEEPTKEQRRIAKYCNFGLLYGAGANVLIKLLIQNADVLLDYNEALQYCVQWRNIWPKIRAWQKQGIKDWQDNIAWQTPMGRQYTAISMTDQLNIQIQGMGSEVAKLALYFMEKALEQEFGKESTNWLSNFIHDAYLYTLPNDKTMYTKIAQLIATSMQDAWKEISSLCLVKNLAMPVTVHVGYNWGKIENGEVLYTHKQ